LKTTLLKTPSFSLLFVLAAVATLGFARPAVAGGKHADADSLYFGTALVGGRDSLACAWPTRAGGMAVGSEVLVVTFDPPASHRARVLKDSVTCTSVSAAPHIPSTRLAIGNPGAWQPQYGILVNDPGAKAVVAGDGVRVSLHGVGGSFTFTKSVEGKPIKNPAGRDVMDWTTDLSVYHDGRLVWQHTWHSSEEAED
jgi:hypothetical protein